MKKAIIILFLCISIAANATTYYLSPTGSDASGNGTVSNPWFTLNKVWSAVAAGDIIYLRGGTYNYNTQQNLSGKNGTSNSNLIQVLAYPGETPILTKGSGFPSSFGENSGAIKFSGDYIYWKGITITGFSQSDHWYLSGMWNENINHCTFDQMVYSYNGAGTWNQGSINGNTWVNCDFHHNADPLTSGDGYGNADGMGFQNSNSSATNNVTNCRFWWNSDDGIDFGNSDGLFIVNGCWSWYNGYIPGTFNLANQLGSGGNGIKTYQTPTSPSLDNTVKRTIQNCLVFHNVGGGISLEETNCIVQVFNNTIYHNGEIGSSKNWQAGIQGWGASMNMASVIKNNISYSHQYTSGNTANFGSNYIVSNNSWTGTITDADFVSLSVTGSNDPSQARQSDGSLPVTTFLHLASTSGLIDKGVGVGLPYSGNGPDLGAFETLTGTPAPVQAPVFVSASVENTTPSILDLTYSLSLTATAPAASSFAVLVNSVARIVNSVAISGTTVHLTLSSPILNGDVLTLSYTKPALNPLQTSSGGLAATISAQPVTNKVVLASSPVYVSSSIENATPSMLTMNYNLSLANIIPATSSFGVLVNAVARTVSSVVISGSKVQLNLSSAVKYGDIVSVTYTKPATSPIQNTSGGTAISLSTQSVTNNLVNPTKDGTPVTITMTISPNHVHRVLNVALSYSASIATQAATITPEIITVANLSGKVFLEKVLTTGVTSVRIPLNLRSGYYNVTVTGTGLIMATQKIVVY